MTRRFLIAALAAALVGCASDGTDVPSEQRIAAAANAPRTVDSYQEEAGPLPVGAIPLATLPDARRGRDLQLSIEYPTRGGPHPVIIFSHGFGSTNRGYVGLSAYWASFGYVVIKPAHADAGELREIPRSEQQQAVEGTWEGQAQPQWRTRVDDIVLILDSFRALEERYPELVRKMDATRIGVSGHGYGAFTTLLVAGGRTFAGATPTAYADQRVRAGIAMSPPGIGASRGVTAESFREVRIPMLFMSGTRDRAVAETEDATWRRAAFENSPPGDKWLAIIENAGYFSFTGRFVDVPREDQYRGAPRVDRYGNPLPEARGRMVDSRIVNEGVIFSRIRRMSAAFWDAYLRNDPAGREYLDRAANARVVELERK